MSISSRIFDIKTRPLPPIPDPVGMVSVPCRLCGEKVWTRPAYMSGLWGRPLCLSCTPPWMDKVPAWNTSSVT